MLWLHFRKTTFGKTVLKPTQRRKKLGLSKVLLGHGATPLSLFVRVDVDCGRVRCRSSAIASEQLHLAANSTISPASHSRFFRKRSVGHGMFNIEQKCLTLVAPQAKCTIPTKNYINRRKRKQITTQKSNCRQHLQKLFERVKIALLFEHLGGRCSQAFDCLPFGSGGKCQSAPWREVRQEYV